MKKKQDSSKAYENNPLKKKQASSKAYKNDPLKNKQASHKAYVKNPIIKKIASRKSYKKDPLKKKQASRKAYEEDPESKIIYSKAKYALTEPKPEIRQKYEDSLQSALYDNREMKTEVKNAFVKCHSCPHLNRNGIAIASCRLASSKIVNKVLTLRKKQV